jgi:hypothetical protein
LNVISASVDGVRSLLEQENMMKKLNAATRRRVSQVTMGVAIVAAVGAGTAGLAGLGDRSVDGAPSAASEVVRSGEPVTRMLPADAARGLQDVLAEPGGAERLQEQLQQHLGADRAGVAQSSADGPVVQALEYGIDGDHFWIKVTAGDIANGVLTTLCARLGPAAPACKILVDVIIKWYEDNHPSHGVWGEIYNTGQIRVGGW